METKTTHRNKEEKRKLLNRLKRAKGQLEGIIRMVEEDKYCPDILIQTSAVSSALNSFNKDLLNNHIKTCVLNDIKNGNEEVIEELLKTLQKLMK